MNERTSEQRSEGTQTGTEERMSERVSTQLHEGAGEGTWTGPRTLDHTRVHAHPGSARQIISSLRASVSPSVKRGWWVVAKDKRVEMCQLLRRRLAKGALGICEC